jgi:uncharacterized integral membrane protein (TIGR00698 family)
MLSSPEGVPDPHSGHVDSDRISLWSRSSLLPGFALTTGVTAGGFALHAVVPGVSALVFALALGIAVANVGVMRESTRPGTAFVQRRLLRVGVVMLGFQVSVSEFTQLGVPGVLAVTGLVAATFLATSWLARRLRLSSGLAVLLGAGFAVCGASAIVAADEVTDATEEEVTFAIALVTLCGTIAVFVIPALAGPLALDAHSFGFWTGASVHDVAQVVAAANERGSSAVHAAIVVKLARVILLAPLVAFIAMRQRHASPAPARRAVRLPAFLGGFLIAVGIGSTGWLSSDALVVLEIAQTVCLAAALAALGTHVRVSRLRSVGGAGVVVGVAASVLIAALGLLATRTVFS